MNRLQYLLIKLSEEASEVSQIALKTAQFGFNESAPDDITKNKTRINQELQDLTTIIEMLNDEFNLGFIQDGLALQIKKQKVNNYFEVSKTLGLISKDLRPEKL